MLADVDVSHFVGLPGGTPRSVAWRGFTSMAGAWHVYGVAMFSVIEKATGQWIGRVGPWCPDGWPGREVGWGLIRAAWGKGYAYEAARAAMDYAFDVLDWDEVIHCIAPDNLRSQALASRLGSERRGPGQLPAPHEQVSIEIWGQSRATWRAR